MSKESHEAFQKLESDAMSLIEDGEFFTKEDIRDYYQKGFYDAVGMCITQIKAQHEIAAVFKK